MKKKYYLKKLDCPNCANKIEKKINELKTIKKANIDFIQKILTIDVKEEQIEETLANIKKIIHELEPEVQVIETFTEEKEEQEKFQFILSLIFFILSILLKNLVPVLNDKIILFLFILSYFIVAREIVWTSIKNLLKREILDEKFLMTTATIGAFFIGQPEEAVAVMLFYQLGEIFQKYAVGKSRNSIASLMDLKAEYAYVEKEGTIQEKEPEKVQIGDIILIKPGEKIPLDGEVIEGKSLLDTSALTGESIPRQVTTGDKVISGCINKDSVLKVKVTANYQNSTVSKILNLVENVSEKKAESEQFITKFAKYYTPIVVILAVVIAIIPPIFTKSTFSVWIYRALSFLVVSCPCALVISIPLCFFVATGLAAKQGILIKGSNYLEAISSLDTIIFDKTGTLTEGVFEVQKTHSLEMKEEKLLELVATVESYSNHPIASSIQKSYAKKINKKEVSYIKEIPGYGIEAILDQKKITIGNEKLMKKHHIKIDKCLDKGTVLHVAIDKVYVGYILISDKIKPTSLTTIKNLKKFGINNIIMVTGDRKEIGEAVAKQLEIDTVYTDLLPNEKVEVLQKYLAIKKKDSKIVFIGDGINDAPVLATSDIGISMGNSGSDAAIESSNIVFMTDDPFKIIQTLQISKRTLKIVKQNIFFAITVKVLVLVLSAIGISSMWNAVLADVGVSILAILNAFRLLLINKKNEIK